MSPPLTYAYTGAPDYNRGGKLPVVGVTPVVRAPCAHLRSSPPAAGIVPHVAALRLELCSESSLPAGSPMTLLSAAATQCLLMPQLHGYVPRVACKLLAEHWFQGDTVEQLRGLSGRLGHSSARVDFELSFALASRAGSVIREMLDETGFSESGLWVSLSADSMPLIGELRRLGASMLVATELEGTTGDFDAAMAEEIRYLGGLAIACGSGLLLSDVSSTLASAADLHDVLYVSGGEIARRLSVGPLAARRRH